MSFRNYKDHVEDGDIIIPFTGSKKMQPVHISKGDVLQTKFGGFPHNSLIGTQFGTKVYSKNKKAWMYLLHPTPELWTTILPHRTQILYITDISMVLLQLNLKPGAIVVESGTGSGSMSHAIIRTIAPSGHLYTFEFHEQRAETARAEFSRHGLADLVTVEKKNVIKHGFGLDHVADAVFLDLPSPWDAIKTSKDTLKVGGGNLCSFSPCIEQVQRTCEELQIQGFKDIRTMECLCRSYNVNTFSFQEPSFGNSEMLKEEKCNTEQLSRKRTREDDDNCPTEEKKAQEISLMPNTLKGTLVVKPDEIEMLKEEKCNTEQLSRKRTREDDENCPITTKEKKEQETEISLMPDTMKETLVVNPEEIEMLKEKKCNAEQLSRKRTHEDDDNCPTMTKKKKEQEISLIPDTMKETLVVNPEEIEMLKEEKCNTEQLSRKPTREDDDNCPTTTKEKKEQETEISLMPDTMKETLAVNPEEIEMLKEEKCNAEQLSRKCTREDDDNCPTMTKKKKEQQISLIPDTMKETLVVNPEEIEMLKEEKCNTEQLSRKPTREDDDNCPTTTEEKKEQETEMSLMPDTMKETLVVNPEEIEMLKEEKCNTEQLSRKRTREDDDNCPIMTKGKKQETEISLMPDTMKETLAVNPEEIEMLKEEKCNAEQLSRKRTHEDDDNCPTMTKKKKEQEISLIPDTMKETLVVNPEEIEMLKEEKCNTEQLSRKRTREDDDNCPTTTEEKEQETEISLISNTMERYFDAKAEKIKITTARVSKQVPGHTGYLTFAILYP